jgi:hypothetical protein
VKVKGGIRVILREQMERRIGKKIMKVNETMGVIF